MIFQNAMQSYTVECLHVEIVLAIEMHVAFQVTPVLQSFVYPAPVIVSVQKPCRDVFIRYALLCACWIVQLAAQQKGASWLGAQVTVLTFLIPPKSLLFIPAP